MASIHSKRASLSMAMMLATILAFAASCGGGGGGDDGSSGGGNTVCLNCSGLSGNSLLLCRIQNSARPGCDEPAQPGDPLPPNAFGSYAFTVPAGVSLGSRGPIDATVPAGTDVTSLVATFTVSGPPGASVAVAGVNQTSGVTANDFSRPVTYAVVPASGATMRHTVTVAVAPSTNIWTWTGGSKDINQPGAYGTKGVAAPANVPGARVDAVSWVDLAGNFWLFGGWGIDAAGASWYLNDLWRFDGTQWTWIGGSDRINEAGVYGTKNVAASTNRPGARYGATAWKDAAGNLWLFGGFGHDANGSRGYLNDLWKFDRANWTWVSGSSLANQTGVYGTKGSAAPANVPEGRTSAVSWRDAAGNFWIFGGQVPRGVSGVLNDLWKFDGTNWTWVSGSSSADQLGIYGTKGVAAATNVPGARQKAVAWVDATGGLLVFGGQGMASRGPLPGRLNDLWRFDGANWTWVSGSDLADQAGVFGSIGVPAAGNSPGARTGAMGWSDARGALWLHGGQTFGPNGTSGAVLNDLWRFDGTNWTSVGASVAVDTYLAKGLAIVTAPFARYGGVVWTEASGKVWLFGGEKGSGNLSRILGDVMRYQP